MIYQINENLDNGVLNMNGLTKQELLRRASNLSQLAFARRFEYGEGMAQGMRAIDVKSGSGLRFTVLEDRGLDFYEMEYKGINLSFLTKNGPVSGKRFIADDNHFTSVMNGGMMFTAGLMNVGGGCVDTDGTTHSLHGRYDGNAASEVSAKTTLTDNDIVTEISGKVTESKLFGEKFELSRKITTWGSKPWVHIEDTLFNARAIPTEFEILYHINLGFPFLDESVTIHTPESHVTPRNEDAKAGFSEYKIATKPIDSFAEQVFFHEIVPDSDGYCYALAINENLSLGFFVRYHIDNLTHLCQWKSMQSGDYVMGLEPSNNFLNSRKGERDNGTLKTIDGFETKKFDVMFGVLDGKNEIDSFMKTHKIK